MIKNFLTNFAEISENPLIKLIGGFFMNARDYLIHLSLKNNGDIDKIMADIQQKNETEFEENPPINAKVITFLDDEYPEILKQVFKPPLVLYCYGDISLLNQYEKTIAVIGSRDNTEYGSEMTITVVKRIAKEAVIVSGLARGIDSIAHQTAIENGGKTIAVLGSGIDYCYPNENLELYELIKNNHLVISEYPGDTVPLPTNFPMRNRIIAALAKTLLVTEAYSKSGTSTTASIALDLNRDICCIPYSAGQDSFCNTLISYGANLVETGEDVLAVMGIIKETAIFKM